MPVAFPGLFPTVVDFVDRILADHIMGLRDRANHIYATAALRDAAMVGANAPKVGQTCVITTGSAAGKYVYSGATVGWTKPWNLPWGRIDSAKSTTDQTITGATNITGETVTWTALANRRYLVTAVVPYTQKTGANGFMYARLVDGSNVEDTHERVWGNINEYMTAVLVWELDSLGAGSVTRRLRMEASAGSIVVAGSSGKAQIMVQDIGPNGAPS